MCAAPREGNTAPVSKRREQGLEKKPWTLLLWTAVAGLIFGLIGFGEVAEDWLRVARNSFHQHKASFSMILKTLTISSTLRVFNFCNE